MARKSSNPKKAAVVRVIFMMGVWVLYLLFALACVSYSEGDTAVRYVNGAVGYHNWCGAFGARIAAAALTGVGPGIFVGIALLGVAMVLWTKGDEITQLPLRIIGSAMLVAVVSTLFNLCSSAADSGGMLGVALGSLLFVYFKHGAWLILLMSLVVAGLLVADEIVLGLPAKFMWVGKRIPAEQVASAAAGAAKGAAGGVWGGFKSMLESLARKDRGKSVEEARMPAPTAVERMMAAGIGWRMRLRRDGAIAVNGGSGRRGNSGGRGRGRDGYPGEAGGEKKRRDRSAQARAAQGAVTAIPANAAAVAEAGFGQLPVAGPGFAG